MSQNTDSFREINPNLTEPDRRVLEHLFRNVEAFGADPIPGANDIDGYDPRPSQDGTPNTKRGSCQSVFDSAPYPGCAGETVVNHIRALNDPNGREFAPTIFLSEIPGNLIKTSKIGRTLLRHYIGWAQTIRNKVDVVMLTHLLLYLFTSLPSAIHLYRHFTPIHGVLHTAAHIWYDGSYTLMMHQHIHMRGVLAKRYAWLDHSFPYVTDPLMGHTWNSYYFHHVKHHHVEGNGPDDLSSTLRYQRDSLWDFGQYVARFLFLAWMELPLYFLRKRRPLMALKTAASEWGNYYFLYLMCTRVDLRATVFVFLLPLFVMRIGLMMGNWGQHAFVDEFDPDSDYRSSITLIDVPSNRKCFNDGYHTSHHLNPMRHWRDHPAALVEQLRAYADGSALIFRDIDYLMVTVRLLMKDYHHLARRLVPIGDQIGMSIEAIAAMLETKTRRFDEDQIRAKFKRR